MAADASSIELHDFVMDEVRRLLAGTGEDHFATEGEFTDGELLDRIAKYEAVAGDLCIMLGCIAYWARPTHRGVLRKALSRSIDRLELKGGLSIWLSLRWYPIILETYCSGVAAVQGGRYDSLADIFFTSAGTSEYGREEQLFVGAISKAMQDLVQSEAFKRIPGHERQYTPISEYLFKILQPQLDDVLFVGKDYERAFDEFEVLLALSAADLLYHREKRIWGPVGRFGWKQDRGSAPLTRVIDDARTGGENWAPIKAGLFGGQDRAVRGRSRSVSQDHQDIGLVVRL